MDTEGFAAWESVGNPDGPHNTDISQVSERVRQLSLEDVKDLISRSNTVKQRRVQLESELKAAVGLQDYARATELQREHAESSNLLKALREAYEISVQRQKKRIRDEAEQSWPIAAELAKKANDVWTRAMDEEIASLSSAQGTLMLVLNTALKFAAEAGALFVELCKVPSLNEHFTSDNIKKFHLFQGQLRLDYNADFSVERWIEAVQHQNQRKGYLPQVNTSPEFWGFMEFLCSLAFENLNSDSRDIILMARDSRMNRMNDYTAAMKALDASLDECFLKLTNVLSRVDYLVDVGPAIIPVGKHFSHNDTKAFYGFAKALLSSGIWPHFELLLSLDDFCTLAANFDGELLHNFSDLESVFASRVMMAHTAWQLQRSGYKVIPGKFFFEKDFEKDCKNENDDESEDIMVPGGGDENDTIIIMRSGCIMRVSFAGSADVSDDDSFLRFAQKGNIPFLDERDICRLILKQRQS